MNLDGHDIGVCSWSLKPTSTATLVDSVLALKLTHVQLALGPLIDSSADDRRDAQKAIIDAGIIVTAGMISFEGENYSSIAAIKKTGGFVPTDRWPARRERALAAAEVAAEMGLGMLTAHVGFVPPSGDPSYADVVERVGEIVAAYAKFNVHLGMETGQEKAHELLQFLNDLNTKHVGVNFDPANMLLYGAGDPCEAIAILARHILHVHVKDAQISPRPGIEWGREVAFGRGDVNVHGFLRALADAKYAGPLVIEREAGADPLDDIAHAIETLEAHLGED